MSEESKPAVSGRDPAPGGPPTAPRFPFIAALTVLVLLAAAVRVAAAGDDFWLDEIWSLRLAQGMRSPLDVFLTLRLDNNHHLNTLFLYLLGDQNDWRVYRLASLAAGVGTVLVGWHVGARRGRLEAAVAVLLT